MAELIDQLVGKFEGLESDRRVYERVWQDIRDLVRPNTSDFTGTTGEGAVRTDRAFDSTAIDACNELASGLHSYLTNPTERWFSIGVVGYSPEEYGEEVLAWLETVADIIYCEYAKEECGFNTCMHECFLDLGAFGTLVPYQEYSYEKKSVSFRSFPIADVYLGEDSEGKVDTVVRKSDWPIRNVWQQFGELPPKLRDEKNQGKRVCVIHMVFPRTDRDVTKRDARNKRFASYWLCKDTKELLHESGFDELPYHPGRWMKLAGEVYGIGPAKNCLPDIKLLNVMERTLVRAGQKKVDPPLMLPDEGYMMPIETAPGSLIYKEDGIEHIEPLVHQGDLQWGMEQANQKREFIRKSFYADWLRMEKDNKEMTAYEVADRRNEKLQLLAPMMGRIQGETLGPMIRRSFNLLNARNAFPPIPQALSGRRLMVTYISPAARAQLAVKANEMGRFIQELVPIVQFKPDVLDTIDWDKYTRKLAEYRGTTRTVVRTRAEVQAAQAERAKQNQVQQMAQVAEPASKALKNVADAKAKGINVADML